MSATEQKRQEEEKGGIFHKAQSIFTEENENKSILHMIQLQVQDETNAPTDPEEVEMLIDSPRGIQPGTIKM